MSDDGDLWLPSLFVGLGGSGVRVLRCIRLLAKEDETGDLSRLLDERKSIQFVAIDTSDEANREGDQLNGHALPLEEERQRYATRPLPRLEDLFLSETRAITEVVASFRRTPFDHDGLKNSYPGIHPWFPPIIPGAEGDLTVAKTQGTGAGQWRILGRVGVFNKLKDIKSRLIEAGQTVESAAKTNRFRIFIICSLAGGTGSGMFWDTAILLRKTYEDALISGLFLLPDAFDGLKHQWRTRPNGYAALKELEWIAAMRQRETLVVDYPTGGDGARFEGIQGSRPIFDHVFLYRAFKADSASLNIHQDTVMATCFRVAQNAVTLCRDDLNSHFNVFKDNPPSSPAAGQAERGMYSTTSCVPLLAGDPDRLSRRFAAAFFRDLGGMVFNSDRWPRLDDGLVRVALLGDGGMREGPLSPDTLAQSLFDRLPHVPGRLDRVLNRFNAGTALVAELIEDTGKRDLPGADLARRCREIYESHADEEVRESWSKNLLARSNTGRQPPEIAHDFGDAAAIYAEDLDALTRMIVGGLARVTKDVTEKVRPLTSDLVVELKRLVSELGEMADRPLMVARGLSGFTSRHGLMTGATTGDAAHWKLNRRLKAPIAFTQIRVTLGVVDLKSEKDESLREAHDHHSMVGPAHFSLRRLFKDAIAHVDELTIRDEETAKRERCFAVYKCLERGVGNIVAAIEQLLDAHSRAVSRVDARFQEVEAQARKLGYRRADGGWRRSVSAALAPLRDILYELPDPASDSAPIEKHVDDMLEAVTALAGENNIACTFADQLLQGRTHEIRKRLSSAWGALRTRVREAGSPDTPGASELDYLDELATVVSAIVPPPDPPPFDGEKFFRDYLGNAELICIGIVRHWCSQGEFLLARLGGVKGLTRYLEACHVDVFSNGMRENTLAETNVAVVYPSVGKSGALKDDDRETLKTALMTAASSLRLNSPQLIGASRHPFIFVEMIHRTSDELNGIHEMQSAYLAITPKNRRRNYHVFAQAVDFPELVSETDLRTVVFCGNPDCDHNIRTQSRTDLICERCGRPILSRCGNEDCVCLDIPGEIRKLRPTATGLGDSGVPYKCPACGGDLLTRWWKCRDHPNKPISTDMSSCPDCMIEYGDGRRSLSDVRRFKSGSGFECPGCVGTGEVRPFRLHWAFSPYFDHGVGPTDLAPFTELRTKHNVPEYYCVNERKGRHALFPMVETNGKPRHVFAYRSGDDEHRRVWRERGGGERRDYGTCYHCGHPVPIAKGDGEYALPTMCPRCKKRLRKCAYCSSFGNVFLEPVQSPLGIADRCPRCTNPMWPMNSTREAVAGRRNSVFCRNLFGCAAGSDPWRVVADGRVAQCRCCNHPSTPHQAPLLPYARLGDYIRRCPLCLTLIGLPNAQGKPEGRDRSLLPAHFNSLLAKQDFTLHEPCPICASRPGIILKWMNMDVFGIPEEKRDDGATKATLSVLGTFLESVSEVPPIGLAPQVGLDVLEILKNQSDDLDVYPALIERELLPRRDDAGSELRTSLAGLFLEASLSNRVVHSRLSEVDRRNREDIESERPNRNT